MAVRWYLPEDGSTEAEQVLSREDELIAPDLVLAEIGNAVWKRVCKNEVSAEDATEIVERAILTFSILFPIGELAIAAMQLSARHNHPIYDCYYLALARRESAPLVTADHRLAALAEQAGVEVERIG